MKKLAMAILLMATPAFAVTQQEQDIRESNHGTGFAFSEVTCNFGAGNGVAALTTADTAKAIAVTFHNIGPTNVVNICPNTAAASCTNALGYQVAANETVKFEGGVRGQSFSCLATTAAITLEVVVEKLE